MGNAIKFTSAGEVSVKVTLEHETEQDAVIRFSVRDTGTGIPADKQEMIFQSFTQVDASITRKFGGTGLGLSISKQLVEKMGGCIGVNSVEGSGPSSGSPLVLPNSLLIHSREEMIRRGSI